MSDENKGRGWEVNKERCSSCIFGAKSPVSPERFKELKRTWARRDTHQTCHHSTIEGGQVACKGYFDAALSDGGDIYPSQAMRIALALDMVDFVDVPNEHHSESSKD
jgi:hypothetical protein